VAEGESRASGSARLGSPWVIAVAGPLIVAGIIAMAGVIFGPEEPVRLNIGLVVDISAEMRERFGDSTRFEAAIAELARAAGASSSMRSRLSSGSASRGDGPGVAR
jgi:hypothetical protein